MSTKGCGSESWFPQGSFVRAFKRGMTAPVAFACSSGRELDLPAVVSVQIRRFSSQPASDVSRTRQDWERVGQSLAKAIEAYGRETNAGFGNAAEEFVEHGRIGTDARSRRITVPSSK